jgi:uncharacterized protein (DUF885 family)
MARANGELSRALRVVDEVWAEVSRALPENYAHYGLPQVSPEEAERRSALAEKLLARFDQLDLAALPGEIALTVKVARTRAEFWAKEAKWYWTVFSPSGSGWFSLFAATAYSCGFLLSGMVAQFQAFRFEDEASCDRYLALVTDYGRLVDQLAARTRGQTERGILMPRVQAQQAAPLLQGLRTAALAGLAVDAGRLAAIERPEFAEEVRRRLEAKVAPAFDAFIGELGADYVARTSDTVGMAQYPQGAEIYAYMVKLNTTLDLTSEAVHDIGLGRMREIRAQMADLRQRDGFDGDDLAYRAKLDADEAWRAHDAAGVAAFFQTYIDRIKPKLEENFSFGPKATYGVRPLPQALEAAMTFGYYDAPKPDRREGNFVFNGANLTKAGLYNLGSLTYHELVPGHHFHLSTQQENEDLHPLRTNTLFNAYNEGWAEYAATLAGEMGMYPTSAERFGRLVMDAFLTCRLVVDTGMNALGWSLEQARDYMRENSFMPETEICSESVRYSCDIPAQALAYKLGDTEIMKMREKMREAMGNRFDIRDFHAAVLRPGALPLPLLAEHVERETERLLA